MKEYLKKKLCCIYLIWFLESEKKKQIKKSEKPTKQNDYAMPIKPLEIQI